MHSAIALPPDHAPALRFRIDAPVLALGVRGAFAVLSGLDNRRDPPELEECRRALAARLDAELAADFVARDPILAGFRALHDAIGRSNRRFPASAESLVALYQRKRLIPRVNPLVDIYNTVSLETRLSLGAHDVAHVTGNVTLRLTDGTERFVPLGATAPESVPAGEYCYLDDSGEILCRLEHRQCERTKVTRDTSACFYILQGNAATPRALIESALGRLVDLTCRLCGGHLQESWVVA